MTASINIIISYWLLPNGPWHQFSKKKLQKEGNEKKHAQNGYIKFFEQFATIGRKLFSSEATL